MTDPRLMSETERPLRSAASAVLEAEAVSPYLHDRGTLLYNPTTGQSLPKDGPAYRALSNIRQGLPAGADAGVVEHLRADIDRKSVV